MRSVHHLRSAATFKPECCCTLVHLLPTAITSLMIASFGKMEVKVPGDVSGGSWVNKWWRCGGAAMEDTVPPRLDHFKNILWVKPGKSS